MKKKWYWIIGIVIIVLIVSLLYYNFIFLKPLNECEIHGGKCYSFGDLFLQTCEDKNMITLEYDCPLRTPQTRCCSEQNKNCNDSDGGTNYYVRGELSGICELGIPCGIWADNCLNETTLLEYSCNNLNGEQYRCLSGCKDGACLDKCDDICISRGFIEGFCESGAGVIVDCNGGESIGQSGDCKTEGASGGSWKACCCFYGE
jgi:hypothetical protein